jgi:prepilin-type N-terminal cleavage/methylation domain-containing protein
MNLLDKKHFTKVSGFTIMEMLVTVAIFGLMMSISIFNYPKLSQVITFNSSSEAVLDSLKFSQIKGSSRGGDYRGDGVYFLMSSPTNYTEFLDATTTLDLVTGTEKSDRAYSNDLIPFPSKPDLVVSTNKIQSNVKINNLCVKNSTDPSPVCGKSKLSVTFVRPSLTANISDLTEFSPGVFNLFEKGYIELSIKNSTNEDKKCLVVYRYGQMELKQGFCINQP